MAGKQLAAAVSSNPPRRKHCGYCLSASEALKAPQRIIVSTLLCSSCLPCHDLRIRLEPAQFPDLPPCWI
eukprot:scaffold49214_cov22-Tisochrysis_lutea.AAC.3